MFVQVRLTLIFNTISCGLQSSKYGVHLTERSGEKLIFRSRCKRERNLMQPVEFFYSNLLMKLVHSIYSKSGRPKSTAWYKDLTFVYFCALT